MFKDKRKKPKKSKFNYGEYVAYKENGDNRFYAELMVVKYIKRYGKRTFMYSENGREWVSEYRLEQGLPF